jgi:hypothetical protein
VDRLLKGLLDRTGESEVGADLEMEGKGQIHEKSIELPEVDLGLFKEKVRGLEALRLEALREAEQIE